MGSLTAGIILAKGALVVSLNDDFLLDTLRKAWPGCTFRLWPFLLQIPVELIQLLAVIKIFPVLLLKRQLSFVAMLRRIRGEPP